MSNNKIFNCEVIIVGAGIAGISAAKILDNNKAENKNDDDNNSDSNNSSSTTMKTTLPVGHTSYSWISKDSDDRSQSKILNDFTDVLLSLIKSQYLKKLTHVQVST